MNIDKVMPQLAASVGGWPWRLGARITSHGCITYICVSAMFFEGVL